MLATKVVQAMLRLRFRHRYPLSDSPSNPELQKLLRIPSAFGSNSQVAFGAQSACTRHTGSLGDSHCNSTPGSGHRPTGTVGSRFTKVRYPLQPVPVPSGG